MNLNSDPSTRKHGTPLKGNKFMPNAHTRHNLVTLEPDTCFLCSSPVIDGFCECLVGQDVEPAQREPQLLKVGSIQYVIDSFKVPGVTYDLTMNEWGVWECTCPSYGYRRECKHCAYLLAELEQPIVKPIPPMGILSNAPVDIVLGRVTTLDLDDDPLVRLFTANGR